MVMAWKTKKVKKDLIILAVILLWGLWEVVFDKLIPPKTALLACL